jgi:drug/metabolite transporter (DMT)-like permease
VGEPGERVVFYFSLSGIVAGGVLTAFWAGITATRRAAWPCCWPSALLATVAQWLMTRAYATGATLGIAALQYLGIVFGFAYGVWLFDDPVTPMALAGMA